MISPPAAPDSTDEHRTRVAAAYERVKARNPWISDGRLDAAEAERYGHETPQG